MSKQFKNVKPGDKIYKVCAYNYKTRIITKKVKEVYGKYVEDGCKVRILCACIDSEYYQNLFNSIAGDSSIHKDKFAPNTYICTNIEDAKIVCKNLANEIISKAEKEMEKLSNRVDKWRSHMEELSDDNYIIV